MLDSSAKERIHGTKSSVQTERRRCAFLVTNLQKNWTTKNTHKKMPSPLSTTPQRAHQIGKLLKRIPDHLRESPFYFWHFDHNYLDTFLFSHYL